MNIFKLLFVFVLLASCRSGALAQSVSIHGFENDAMVSFAIKDIEAALDLTGHSVKAEGGDLKIVFSLDSERLDLQAYSIQLAAKSTLEVIGGDKVGLMYGGLDLAETITLNGLDAVKNKDETPYLEKRGIKFNIPLDGRTPAYSDAGSAAQKNMLVVWEMDFWKEYLDTLARYRYNVISLWNMHPFPSMVQVPEYPEVALSDVMRADLSVDEWKKFNERFRLRGTNMVNSLIREKLVVIKEMTPEEKVRFWQDVMVYAKNRGIEFQIITWNVFTWGATGKHGITQDAENPITKDYIRKSVTAMFETYPLLAGIGVTAGENMDDLGVKEKEEWLWEAYGLGILDHLENEPDRHIRFIHRYWWADMDEIVGKFEPMAERNVTFDLSFKYARARLYSGEKPPFSRGVFNSLPENTRMWCNLRNDDIYIMRWADPDYVRTFIRNLPNQTKTPGFYMGSDGYVFGREFISKHPDTANVLEVEKHWLNFMLWGRLGYNPNIKNTVFKKAIEARFPNIESGALYDAWRASSKVIPLINRFYWNDWDFQWHVESGAAFSQRNKGGHSIERLINKGKSMDGSGILNIRDYCRDLPDRTKFDGITPDEIANQLDVHSREARSRLPLTLSEDQALLETVDDIKSMAHLGSYNADRIRGAISLCLYQNTNDKQYQEAAIVHLKNALKHWNDYAALIMKNYKPQLFARIGWVDIGMRTQQAEEDLRVAREL